MSIRTLLTAAAANNRPSSLTGWANLTWSGIYSGLAANPPTEARLRDNLSDTGWGGAGSTAGQWLRIDFTGVVNIRRVYFRAMLSSAPGGWGVSTLVSRQLQYLDGSNNWVTFLTFNFNDVSDSYTNVAYVDVTAQAVRLFGTGTDGRGWTSISELYFE